MFAYRNAWYDSYKGVMNLWTWDEEGNRVTLNTSFEPYLYLESREKKDATSIYGTPLKKITFPKQFDRFKFVKDCGTDRIFYNLNCEQQFLIDTFAAKVDDPDFARYPLRTFFLDIEVHSPDEFPEPKDAKHPINVITIYDGLTGEVRTWGAKAYTKRAFPEVVYEHHNTERGLITAFLKYWKENYPDIASGWNSEGFDFPYIINRISRLFGEDVAKELSPVGNLRVRENIVNKMGQTFDKWSISGISCIDYMEAYKTYARGLKASYNLNFIAQEELGEGKVAYNAVSLAQLADDDWDKFIDYNIQDVLLLVKLDKKLKYINIIRQLAYRGCTTFEKALGKVEMVAGAVAIQAKNKNLVIPTFKKKEIVNVDYDGGYVRDPVKGFHENVISFDANSLYPNAIITLNISPETKVGKIVDAGDGWVEVLLTNNKVHKLTTTQFSEWIDRDLLSVSRAKVLYSQKKKGLMPAVLDDMYSKRKKTRGQAQKLLDEMSKMNPNTEEYKRIAERQEQLDILQNVYKLFMNSAYGAFANQHFPFFDLDHASSITLTGQAIIKESATIIDKYIEQKWGLPVTTAIAGDTDSIYLSLTPLFKHLGVKLADDSGVTQEAMDVILEIEKCLNDGITDWCKNILRSADSRIVFKRETICDKALFIAKKRYVAHLIDAEGVKISKFKYVGGEMVSSATPPVVKKLIKKAIETAVMSQDRELTNAEYKAAHEAFKKYGVNDLAKRSGVNGVTKAAANAHGLSFGTGTPAHVKAALAYNYLLKHHGVENKYEPIKDGSKIKSFPCNPNPFGIDVIAYLDVLPVEFGLTMNYDKVFKKLCEAVVENIYDVVGWKLPDLVNESETDLTALFS